MRKLVCAALLLPLWSVAAAANESKTVGFDYELAFDPVEIPYYDRLSLTEDGQRIAYSARRKPAQVTGEREYDPRATPAHYLGSRIYVAERAGRSARVTTRPLCAMEGNSWAGAWSHDGSKFAFYADANGKPGLWVSDAQGCRQLGSIGISGLLGGAPQWSADDGTLYFVTIGEQAANDAGQMSPQAPPDFSKPTVLVFKAGGEGGADDARQPLDWLPAKYAIARVDATTGEASILVPSTAEASPAFLRLSSSGRWLSYLSGSVQRGAAGDFHKQLVAVSLADGTRKTIAAELPELWGDDTRLSYSWHPQQDKLVFWRDGGVWLVEFTAEGPGEPRRLAPELGRLESSIYWFTRDGRLIVGTEPIHSLRRGRTDVSPRGLAIVSLEGRPAKRLPLDAGADFVSLVMADDRTVWQPDDCCITLQQRDKLTGQRSAVRIRIDDRRSEVLWKGHAQLGDNVIATADHQQLISVYQDLQNAEDISLFSSRFVRQRFISLDPRLDDIKVGAAETFDTTVPGHAGSLETVRTTVLLPPGAKRGDRLPAVVMVYPGSDVSNLVEYFGGGSGNTIPTLLFTSRGFAVVMAHVKLGPERTQNDIAKQMVDSLLPQLYRAAELGYVDIERLALSGQSYGGYSTALIASQTNLFRAGIAVNGKFDVAGSYGAISRSGRSINITWAEQGQGRMGTHPWTNLPRYLENSPYYRADRIYTPLLLLSGEGDQRVPSEESKRMFTALRRLDRPVELALYAGQGHVIHEWTQANAIDASQRTMAFLRKHLKIPKER